MKQRKLVQWAIAYLAGAWVVLQVLRLASGSYAWPDAVMHVAFGVLAGGLVVVLVLAWYHGERGAQHVSGAELLLIALVLALGGGLLWHFARAPVVTGAAHAVAAAISPSPAARSARSPARRLPQALAERRLAGSTVASSGSAAASIAAPPIPAKSVAVLPFVNGSADKNNAYFADGIQDLILTKLANIGDLKVIARSSTMHYGSHPQNLTLVGQQLGVATVLEGSVQKAGNQVLINVQLIDVKTDSHLWAKSYQRTLKNIFGVEGEVAEKVADDPKFALAYAELALLQGDQVGNHFKVSADLPRAVLANARKAVALQPNLPEGHAVLGMALMKSSPQQALAELQTAVRLGPNNPNATIGLVVGYIHYAHWQQAAAQLAKLLQLDPRNGFAYWHMAMVDMALRRYTTARQILTRGLAIDPQNQSLIGGMSRLATLQGQPRAARRWAQQLSDPFPFKPFTLASIDLLLRDNTQALQWAQSIRPSASYAHTGMRELLIARAALATGDAKLGASALAKARGAVMAELKKHPDTTELHARLAGIEALRGHRAAALRSAGKATALFATYPGLRPFTAGYAGLIGPGVKAAVLAHFGDAKAACVILDKLLAAPGTGANISPALLKLDPTWDPIRHDPAFQALLKKYAEPQTTALPAAPRS